MSVAVRWRCRPAHVVVTTSLIDEDDAGRGFRRTATDTVALPWCAVIFSHGSGLRERAIGLLHSKSPTTSEEDWEGDRVGRRSLAVSTCARCGNDVVD